MSSQSASANACNVVGIADQLLERGPAEAYISDALGVPVEMIRLDRAAQNGSGPPFRTWSRKPLYRRADLLSWATSRLSKPIIRSSGNGGHQSAS